MSTKRILAVILSVLMLAALAVPVLAYTDPNGESVSYYQESKFHVSGSSANFEVIGTATNVTAKTKTATFSLADEVGAWHLSGTGAYASQTVGTEKTGGTWVNSEKGMTVDMYAKLTSLRTLDYDFAGGVVNNPNSLYFSGLVLDLCSAQPYMVDTSKANNEMQAVFAHYESEDFGTDTVLILPYGNRNDWANTGNALVYYFTRPTDYARYTFTFDAVDQTTTFYINGEAQYVGDTDATVADVVALSYRSKATSNFLNINLNNSQAPIANSATSHDIYIDQIDAYPDALVPAADGTMAKFEGDPDVIEDEEEGISNETFTKAYNFYRDFDAVASTYYSTEFWTAFGNLIDMGLEAIAAEDQEALDSLASTGNGSANWFLNRLSFKSVGAIAGSTATDAVELITGDTLYKNTPVLACTDKLLISHASADGTNAGWSKSATIVTAAGLDVLDITSYGGSNASAVWRVYIFAPVAGYTGIYELINLGGNTVEDRPVIPEGGFAYILHMDGKTNTTITAANNAEDFTKYQSMPFWMSNIHAVYSGNYKTGNYYRLNGVTIENGVATLANTGTFQTYKDPNMTSTSVVYREAVNANPNAVAGGPQYATRDLFENFVANANIENLGTELPEIEPAVNANFTNAYNYYLDIKDMADEYFNPTFWGGFEAFINKGLQYAAAGDQTNLDAISDSGVNGTWFINRFHFRTTAGINKTTGGADNTVNGTEYVIPANTVVLKDVTKIHISHSDYDGQDLAWTNSCTIVTEPGANVYDFTSYGGSINTNNWRVYVFEPTEYEDIYKIIAQGGNSAANRPDIPEGGFAIIFYTAGKNQTNCNTAAAEYNKYSSGLFWARNVHAIYAGSWGNGNYVKATGITLNDGAAATIDVTGSFKTYKDPTLGTLDDGTTIGDAVYRTTNFANPNAVADGPQYITRDAIAGFQSNAYVEGIKIYDIPGDTDVTVDVQGAGSVAADLSGKALDAITAETTVQTNDLQTLTLTAGEGFIHWVNAKNGAVISTDAALTVPGGKALSLVAVFADAAETETYAVYFKDSKTGKIYKEMNVAAGTVITEADLPAASCKGWTLAGWKAAGIGNIVGAEITGTTVAYTVYESNAEDFVTISINTGAKTVSVDRRYGSVATVSSAIEGFSYWTLNGVIVSTDRVFAFAAPSADCELVAVAGQTAPAAVAAVIDLSADDNALYFMMSRSGDIAETGVLMTRKAEASDLTVDTTVNTVTRGVSTADDSDSIVGFRKDITGKEGTWLVRGYIILTDGTVVYTDVASITIA